MSLYKNLDKELAKLEDPKVTVIKILKDKDRPEASFRSTIYNVASHRGLSISVKQLAPCIYEVTRKKRDTTGALNEEEAKVEKNLKIITYTFNINTVAAALILINEGVVMQFDFASYSKHDLDPLKEQLDYMGLLGILESMHLENTMNSLEIRRPNEVDKLASEAQTQETTV